MKQRIPGPSSPEEDRPGERDTIVVEDETLRAGFAMLPTILLRNRSLKLSHSAKLTYALLLSYAWQDGSCFPGQARMADDLDTTRQAVSRYLAELIKARVIRVQRRGLGLTNVYVLPDLRHVLVPDRLSRRYGAWRRLVRMRDRVCRDCGAGTDLHAHHILHWHAHPEGRFDPANGVLVCGDCHRKRHPEIPDLAWEAMRRRRDPKGVAS